nr:PREDICTED: scavenger receptor class F member 1 [Equus przewalskii]
MGLGLLLPLLLLWTRGTQGSELDPNGQHVCIASSSSAKFQCCPGWRQKDQECTIPICEGQDACREDEVCVKPGLCRCKPGFFGAQCNSRCPGQYWGPDCRESCACHPHGQCEPATGVCHCQADRWGDRCEFACTCGPHGRCDPVTGACRCEPGWCLPSCGHCKQNEPCSADTGSCESCEPGWNGTQCHQPCSPGTFGESCRQQCPHCRLGEACQPDTGHCQRCDPGWLGPRCEDPCPNGTFGEGCGSTCPTCDQGACDAVTGECVCNAGYWGPSCNTSCPSGFHGNNCSIPCECSEGPCHPVSGACQQGSRSQDAALIAGILVPLLLLLLGLACCACCCWAARLDPKDRPVRDGAAVSRMKLQVWGALTSLGSALPCGSLSSHKLPWVTASLSRPLPAGPRTTPSLRIPSLERRTRVLPTVCHPKKGWSLWPKQSRQRSAWLEVPSLPRRMPPRHSPSLALPA